MSGPAAGAESFVETLRRALADLDPPARAHVVRPPGLSDGEDIEQWIAGRRDAGLTDADILAELLVLIEPTG